MFAWPVVVVGSVGTVMDSISVVNGDSLDSSSCFSSSLALLLLSFSLRGGCPFGSNAVDIGVVYETRVVPLLLLFEFLTGVERS